MASQMHYGGHDVLVTGWAESVEQHSVRANAIEHSIRAKPGIDKQASIVGEPNRIGWTPDLRPLREPMFKCTRRIAAHDSAVQIPLDWSSSTIRTDRGCSARVGTCARPVRQCDRVGNRRCQPTAPCACRGILPPLPRASLEIFRLPFSRGQRDTWRSRGSDGPAVRVTANAARARASLARMPAS